MPTGEQLITRRLRFDPAPRRASPDPLVSKTVRSRAGSGFAFADRGERELKRLPDLWRLYVAEPA
jgi:hypothetical protein